LILTGPNRWKTMALADLAMYENKRRKQTGFQLPESDAQRSTLAVA